MKYLRKWIVSTLRATLRLSGDRGRWLISEALATSGQPLVEAVESVKGRNGITMRFFCLGDLPIQRVRTIYTKEPETIDWIDSFCEGDTLWDIGANIGLYTVYAAATKNCRVLAFEPSPANYFLLNRNIEINGLDNRVQAYCVAVADKFAVDVLHMRKTELGGAMSNFGSGGEGAGAIFSQGAIGISIDEFVTTFSPPFPTHMKIDVDGIEHEIVRGALNTAEDKRLKSISVELDSEDATTAATVALIESKGFKLTARRQGEAVAKGAFKTVYNYQFHRQ
jgi:FkbM family methyltransferase